MTDASRPRIEMILQQLDQLPPLPAVATRVLQVASSDASNVKDVVRIIEADPAIAARILQLVHRADSGIAGNVTDLQRAITLLGFDTVRCAILAISVLSTFRPGQPNPDEKFSRTEFWKHCIGVACCCELLAIELGKNWGKSAGVEPSEAFLAGLLHDMGKIALDATLPKSYAKVIETADLLRGNIADVERSVVGVDHMVVGKRLAERWQLPATLRDVIWLHGQLPQALPPSVRNERLVNVVTLSDMLVREQRLGYSGNYSFPIQRQTLLDALGLMPNQADTVLAKLVPAIESRASALGIGGTAAEELYRNAFQQANRELSRVTDQLATRNRKLSIRAKYFEAVAAFQSELRPDAPPATVLQAIGQTAAGVLDTSVAAVFSLPPGAGYAETIVVDRDGRTIQSQTVDAQGGEPAVVALDQEMPQPVGVGPLQAVPAEMEWLVESFSPRLADVQRFWIPLEIEGQIVGGVVWGASGGELQRLSPQQQEMVSLACGWALALRTSQIRNEARALSEQLADVNRRLLSAQSEIDRTRMLTSVAEIAAGAAHEMNNPLAVISGRSQLLAATLTDPKQRENAKLIFDKSQNLSDIITALMHFAKPQTPRPEAHGIESLFRDSLELAKQRTDLADRQIEVRVGELPAANVDGEQITAALAEVVINAVQATDENGRLVLSASFDAFGQRLVLTIADNGCGMDEHVLRHAFDPFFSAKPAGRQPGMGLAKALRWIESAGGTMRLESRVAAGTRAIVILPAAQQSLGQTNLATPVLKEAK